MTYHLNRVHLTAALLFALLGCLLPGPARAHGYIVRAIPEDRATLDRAPTRIQYWFSEELEPDFSEMRLLDANGDELARGGVDPENRALMVLRPPAELPDGAYVVSLRPAFASDGHAVSETRVFFVGESVAGVQGAAASDQAVMLEVVWRGVVLSATTLLLGVTSLYTLVLRPAWGNRRYVAGLLPPRVMSHLTWIAGAALAVALAGNVLALLQNASVLFDRDILTILQNGSWNTARIGSRFGDVWTVRMALMLVFGVGLALTIIWREDKPRTVAPFWDALTWAAAFIVATFAVSSHASGSLVMPWVAMLMHWLHTTAVAVWTGGLAALVLVLPVALRPYAGEQRRQALYAVTRRFSRLAVGMLLLVVTTGVYNALNWLYTPSELTGTAYGVSLVYKLLLFGGLLVVAAVGHVAANPARYARLSTLMGRIYPQPALPAEVVVAFAVLLFAGLVSATPPPTPGFINDASPAPRAAQTVDGVTVDMTISPGGLGVNTYDARIYTGDQPVEGATVYVRLVRPSQDVRGVWHAAEPVEPGLYVAVGDEFDTEGAWLALVDVATDGATFTRYAFTWDISDAASVLASVPPGVQHWAALGAVLMALGWAAAPGYRAFAARMNFDAVTVALVLVAALVTTGVTAAGFRYIGALEARNAAYINPPPTVVNPITPDAASLRQGAAGYTAACDWEANERIFASLVERLPRTRNDELYAVITEGWRDLPACDATGEDAWHIVNYLRTFERR